MVVKLGRLVAIELAPLELPRREAPDVEVILVEAGGGTIVGELDLELELVLADGQVANRAGSPDSGASPGPIWLAGGDLSVSDGDSGFVAKDGLVWHWLSPRARGAAEHIGAMRHR